MKQLINEAQRFQELAGILNENKEVDEGVGKAIGTGLLGLGLALGSPKDVSAQTMPTQTSMSKPASDTSISGLDDEKAGSILVQAYLKNPFTADMWSKKSSANAKLFSRIKSITDRGGDIQSDDLISLGEKYKDTNIATDFLNRPSKPSMEENIESIVNEALAKLREEETQEELTPDQIEAIKNIVKLSEAAEGDDKAKYEKLKSELKKVALTAAFVAALITSLSSCSTSGYGCHGRGKIITRVRGNGY